MAHMIVGASRIEIDLVGVRSLKEKRSIVKSINAQIKRKFNAAAAEVDFHNVWQSTAIGISVVSTNRGHAEDMLEGICGWLEYHRPDLTIIDQSIEIIYL